MTPEPYDDGACLSYSVLRVEKRGGDARTEGKRAYIGGGTVSRSVCRKEKMGAPKKPPMYLHIQIESGAHRVGRTPENVNIANWFAQRILKIPARSLTNVGGALSANSASSAPPSHLDRKSVV